MIVFMVVCLHRFQPFEELSSGLGWHGQLAKDDGAKCNLSRSQAADVRALALLIGFSNNA